MSINSNISCSISNLSFVSLLASLQSVCKEANIKAPNLESEISLYRDRVSYTNLNSPKPPLTVDEAEATIRKNVKDAILVYEAAKRVNMPEIATRFLQEWQQILDEKVQKKLGKTGLENVHMEFQCDSPCLSVKDAQKIDKKIQKIMKEIKLPHFSNLQDSEKEIQRGLIHILSKEVVFRTLHEGEKLQKMPSHVHQVVPKVALTTHEYYLLAKYYHLGKHITFNSDATDDLVQNYLAKFQIETIDISNCTRLTEACLKNGHRTLQYITMGTNISEEMVTRDNFPSFKGIIINKEPDSKVRGLTISIQNLRIGESSF